MSEEEIVVGSEVEVGVGSSGFVHVTWPVCEFQKYHADGQFGFTTYEDLVNPPCRTSTRPLICPERRRHSQKTQLTILLGSPNGLPWLFPARLSPVHLLAFALIHNLPPF